MHFHFFHSLTARGQTVKCLLAPWSFGVGGSRFACRIMLPLRIDLAVSHSKDMFAIKSRSPILLILYHSTGYEWLPRGLSLLISLDCCKLLQKIIKICWLGPVKVLCNLISWTITEPSTIKKSLFNSSICFTPYQTHYSSSKPSPLFKSPAEDFPCFVRELCSQSHYNHWARFLLITLPVLNLPLEEAKPLGREVSGKKWKLKLMENKRTPFLKMREKDRDREGKRGKIRREFDIEKCTEFRQ